ncbi:MAG: hypothetical protein HS115_05525 [Spirochaetales bacterium]|nr:hypothetical protein [Spirochaetales bacterium]
MAVKSLSRRLPASELHGVGRLPGKFVIRLLPIPLIIENILKEYPGYQLIEDLHWPSEFSDLMKKIQLTPQIQGSILLRDRRPLRSLVIVERASLIPDERSRFLDLSLRRLLSFALKQSRKVMDDVIILPLSSRLAGRFGFSADRPVLFILWAMERPPLEHFLSARPVDALTIWKESLALPQAQKLLPHNPGDFRLDPVGEASRERFCQKVFIKKSKDRVLVRMLSGPAAQGKEAFKRRFEPFLRCRSQADFSQFFRDEPLLCGMVLEIRSDRRLRAILCNAGPLIYRARGESHYQSEDGVRMMRGRLSAEDQILLLPGRPAAGEAAAIFKLLSKKDSQKMSALTKLLRKGEAGRGLWIRFQ